PGLSRSRVGLSFFTTAIVATPPGSMGPRSNSGSDPISQNSYEDHFEEALRPPRRSEAAAKSPYSHETFYFLRRHFFSIQCDKLIAELWPCCERSRARPERKGSFAQSLRQHPGGESRR